MNVLTVIATTLYTVVGFTYATNLFQLSVESKKLKADGKTPLTKRNFVTISLAAIAEVVFVLLSMLVISLINVPHNIAFVVIVFLALFAGRNVAAYLAAWGAWSIFVKIDTKKMKKQLEEEKERAL
jgi:polyferredoxin